MTRGVGTVCWLAPEVIRHGRGNERIDVYAFGVVREDTGDNISTRLCPASPPLLFKNTTTTVITRKRWSNGQRLRWMPNAYH